MAAAWIVAVVVLVIFQALLPQRSGVFALTEVLEPYIVLSAFIAAPFALLGRTRTTLALVVILMSVAVGRYALGFVDRPSDSRSLPVRISVTAWNVEAGADGGQRVLDGLQGVASDLIGLEELQPPMADALTSDAAVAAAYPYRALSPDSSVLGVGLISRFPISEQWFSLTSQPRSSSAPPYLRAVVAVPGGQSVAVYVVHPLPGRFQSVLGVPVGIETTTRDAGIAQIRAKVAADIAAHMPVIVMGDINTTPREPAYRDLSAGLLDARSAGDFPGLTWRLDPFKVLPFGLLRIDYVFSSGQPLDYSVRCTNLSDHCLVTAELGFGGSPP